jgi:hypothetical protein
MERQRIVTGFNVEGRSIVASAGPSPARNMGPLHEFEELWAFDGMPASLTDPTDPAAVSVFRRTPEPGRIICRTFTTVPASVPPDDDLLLNPIPWDMTESRWLDDDPGMHRRRRSM